MVPAAFALDLPRRSGAWSEIVSDSLVAGHPLRGAVLLLGNFDGFHLGHQALIGLAHRIAGGRPVAVMSCEPHPRSFFGTEPAPFRLVTPFCKRRILAPYGVDFIYSPQFDHSFAGLSPTDFVDSVLVEALGVAHVIAGSDFRFGCRRAGDMALLSALSRTRGFEVSYAPEVIHAGLRASSSRIRSAIRVGDLRQATQLLGGGWLVETRRRPCGHLELHPDLCRPRAGRYLAAPEGGRRGADRIAVEITEDGGFLPLGPQALHTAPVLWRLEAQD